ncbi:MAG: type II toxin-antitoxin system HigB family toxin [Luteimonas sp.]
MRVISNKALVDFAIGHPGAGDVLQAWRKLLESATVANFAGLRTLLNSVDKVGDYVVFDIGGNKYRIVAAVHFNRRLVYVRHVFTHAQYDRWSRQR